jgi:hypothetical protein
VAAIIEQLENRHLLAASFGFVVADQGGANGGDDLAYRYPLPNGPDAILGTGTGTFNIEAIAYHTISGKLYGADGDQLVTIGVTTGVATPVGPFGSGNGAFGTITFGDIDGLSFDPFTGLMYGVVRRKHADDLLIRIDPVTGSRVADAFGAGIDYVSIPPVEASLEDFDDLTFDPFNGQMYAVNNNVGSADRLVRVDKSTGATTDVGPLGVTDMEGLTFDASGNFYGTTGEFGGTPNSVWDIDKVTGMAGNQRALSLPGVDFEAVAFNTEGFNTITGRVFRDVNGDSVFNGSDAGQGGVTVRLRRDVNGDGQVDPGDILLHSLDTDAAGNYSFAFPATGGFVLDIDTGDLSTTSFLTTDNREAANFGTNFGLIDSGNDFAFTIPAAPSSFGNSGGGGGAFATNLPSTQLSSGTGAAALIGANTSGGVGSLPSVGGISVDNIPRSGGGGILPEPTAEIANDSASSLEMMVGASLSGFVYHELTGDSQWQPAEPGLASRTVSLVGTSIDGDSVQRTTITDDAGFYEFLDLPAGTYALRLGSSAGFSPEAALTGQVDGVPTGLALSDDLIAEIQLTETSHGVQFNFGQRGDSARPLDPTVQPNVGASPAAPVPALRRNVSPSALPRPTDRMRSAPTLQPSLDCPCPDASFDEGELVPVPDDGWNQPAEFSAAAGGGLMIWIASRRERRPRRR